MSGGITDSYQQVLRAAAIQTTSSGHQDSAHHHTGDNLTTTITQANAGTGSYVQALIKGFNWTGNIGQASTVTYSYNATFFSDNSSNLNGAQHQAAQQALQAWANVANIRFSETGGGNANLALRQADLPSGTAGITISSYSGAKLINSEINIDVAQNGFTPGGSAYFTFLHEIGHAIGMKHSGNYNPSDSGQTLSAGEDNWNATVMSYRPGSYANTGNFSATPMIYDIAAAQYLYGANNSYNAGNTVYNVTGSRVAAAIWDGNGNDTINAAGSGGGVIDLREGLQNVSAIGGTALWMAFGANIENAIGSNANDTLYGNALSNQLFGNNGNDNLLGFSGNDFLQGNMGNDVLDGSDGNDTVLGGKDPDILMGGTGDDAMNGNMGNDNIRGNAGNDRINGGQNEDVIYGEEGNDFILGDMGNDTLYGGAGSDIFAFNPSSGRDTIQDFELAGDRLWFNPLVFTSADQALTAVTYNGGSTTIDLGGGNTITLAGIGGGLSPEDFMVG